jgi:hypothetical protein
MPPCKEWEKNQKNTNNIITKNHSKKENFFAILIIAKIIIKSKINKKKK